MPTPTLPLQSSNSPQLRSPSTPTRKERERDAIISAASRGWSNRSTPSSKIALKAHSALSPNAEFSPSRLFGPPDNYLPRLDEGAGVESTKRRTSSSFSHVRNNSLVQNSPFKQSAVLTSPIANYDTISPNIPESKGLGLGLHPSRSPHRHMHTRSQPNISIRSEENTPPLDLGNDDLFGKPKSGKPRKSTGYNLLPSAQRVTQSPWRLRDTSASSAGSDQDNIAYQDDLNAHQNNLNAPSNSAFSPPTPQETQRVSPLKLNKRELEKEPSRPPSASSTQSRRKTVTFEEKPDVHEFEREIESDSIATGFFSPQDDIDAYDEEIADEALVGASWEDTPPMPPPTNSLVNIQKEENNVSEAETPELDEDYAHEGILEEYSQDYSNEMPSHELNINDLEVDTSYHENQDLTYQHESSDDEAYEDEDASSLVDQSYDDSYEYNSYRQGSNGSQGYEDVGERTQMEDLVDSILRDELIGGEGNKEFTYPHTSPLRMSNSKKDSFNNSMRESLTTKELTPLRDSAPVEGVIPLEEFSQLNDSPLQQGESTPVKDSTPNKMRHLGIGRPQSEPSPSSPQVSYDSRYDYNRSVDDKYENKDDDGNEHSEDEDDIKDRSVLPELPHSSPLWALSPPAEEVEKMPRLTSHDRAQYETETESTPNIDSILSPITSPQLDQAALSPNAAGSFSRRRNLREAVQEKLRKKKEAEEANTRMLKDRQEQQISTPLMTHEEYESQPPSPVKEAISAVAPSPIKQPLNSSTIHSQLASQLPKPHYQQNFENEINKTYPDNSQTVESKKENDRGHTKVEDKKIDNESENEEEVEAKKELEGFAPFISPSLPSNDIKEEHLGSNLQRNSSTLRGNANLKDREYAILLSRRKSRAEKGERPIRRRSVSADALETPHKRAVYRPSSGLPTPGALNEGTFGDDVDREIRALFQGSDRTYRLHEHDEVIRASSDLERISHSSNAGDIDNGKAWRVVRRPSDMNEYSRHLKDIRGNDKFSEATGKVFVKVVGLRDLELPLPGKQTYFCCTLDNGINHVATPYTVLKKEAPIGQEFDLILNKNLFFTLSFKCRMEGHLQPPRPPRIRPVSQTPTPQPPPSPSKSGFRSLFSSPKKDKKRAEQHQQQLQMEIERSQTPMQQLIEEESEQLNEPLLKFLQKDGTFGSTRIIYNEIAPKCQGRMIELILPLEGKFTRPGDNQITKCIVGKLVLHVLGIPSLQGVRQKDLPLSLDHTVKVMKEMQWHKRKVCATMLTQLGGGVTSWKRRMYSLVGGRIIVFNEISKRAIATIELLNAICVEDAQKPNENALEKGWVDEGDSSVERSFVLILNRGENDENKDKIHLFADNDHDKELWLRELRGIIGRIPPKPLWAQALEQKQSPPPSALPISTSSRNTLSPIQASPIPSAQALHQSSSNIRKLPPPAPSTGRGLQTNNVLESVVSRTEHIPTPKSNKNSGPVSVSSATKNVNNNYDKKSLRGSIFSSIGSRSQTPTRSQTPETSFRSTTRSFFGLK